MRKLATLPLCVLSTTLAVIAQGVVPPLVATYTNPWPNLGTGPVPGSNVQQVHFQHLAGDPPNVFYCGMTCDGLPAANGGVGGSDLVAGRYDVLTDTYTTNNDAAALNTTGTEFGLTIHSSGLFATFDRLPGLPWLASRSSVTAPWQLTAQISGLPTQSYYDPSLATYHGQLHLIHVLGVDIAMTPIDPLTAAAIGPSVVIANAARAGSTANSPTPVTDPNGELIGISHHDVLGADNDHYMSLDLDPATPAVLLLDTTSWINNGGFIGGSFFDAEYLPAPYHVLRLDTYWFTGGRAPIGSTMHVRMFTPPTTGPETYLSLYAVSSAFLPAGLTLAGIDGLLGVNPNGAFATSLVLHDNQNGEAVSSFAVPNAPGLNGVRLPMQCATLEAVSNTIHIGNTASLTIN